MSTDTEQQMEQIEQPEVDKLAVFRQQVKKEAAKASGVIDTYDSPAVTEEDDPLAKYRGVEPAPVKKMSEAAALRLRAAAERDKANRAANITLVEWFNKQIAANPENVVEIIMDVMYRIARGYTADIRNRAIKAAHFLSRGFKVYSLHDLMFLGELLPEESSKTIQQIVDKYPYKEGWQEQAVAARPAAKPSVKLCANKWCRKGEGKTKGVVPKGSKGGFCSKECRWAADTPKMPYPTVQTGVEACGQPA